MPSACINPIEEEEKPKNSWFFDWGTFEDERSFSFGVTFFRRSWGVYITFNFWRLYVMTGWM